MAQQQEHGAALAPIPTKPRGRARGHALHLLLFLATLYTTTLAGAISEAGRISFDPTGIFGGVLSAGFLRLGIPYSLCLLAILGIHEMGHYLACRRYGVDVSLPYFLPGFPFPIGTFGAFIRIRGRIPDRNVLFDIGVAGPIAGFIVAVPVLAYGILTAEPIPVTDAIGSVDEPLLLTWLLALLAAPVPEGHAIVLSGPLMAGWVGCLATAINLLPAGQLDGGHVCYALSPRSHRLASMATLLVFAFLGLVIYPGWLFFATLMILFGPRHPPVQEPTRGLTSGRLLVSAACLAILVLCFIPRPFPTDS